jgi:hypothetical protein
VSSEPLVPRPMHEVLRIEGFRFTSANQANFAIANMTRLLAVSPSGSWLSRCGRLCRNPAPATALQVDRGARPFEVGGIDDRFVAATQPPGPQNSVLSPQYLVLGPRAQPRVP